MWWQLFIVLLATAAASDDDDDYEVQGPNCMGQMYHECEPEHGKEPDFPGNAEELEEFCKFATKYFECNERVLSSCEGETSDFGRFVRETGANVRRVCTEDPLLRTALTAILPCFKENFRIIGSCDNSLDQESFNEAMNELGVAEIEDLDDSGRRCLNILYGVGCTAATTGLLCGDVARDIVLNIIQGFDVPFEFCPAGVKDKVPEIAEMMQIEAEKLNSVDDKLKKKK